MPYERFNILDNADATLQLWKKKLEFLLNRNLNGDNILSTGLTLGTGQVKANNIDFGTGANQVDASDIPIIDGSSYFVGSNVELALQQIGSTLLNPSFTNLTVTSTLQAGTAKFGNSSDFGEFESDGTLKFNGNATIYHDELQSLLFQNYVSPVADIVINSSEGSVTFKQSASITDYVTMNVQINHGWKVGTALYPHLHWWQNSSNIPNWLMQYRFQNNGGAKVDTWASVPRQAEVFGFTAGSTINQITTFGSITPTSDADLSDIVQFRLIRDGDNDSSAFGSTDLLAGDVNALNFDMHVQLDTIGSRQEYIK